MFKKMILCCLLVVGLAVGASAAEFDAIYDKGPECFMSLDYTMHQGPAPDVWIIQTSNTLINRKYLREGGDIWRSANKSKDEVLPCCAGKTVEPAWLCPEEPATAVIETVVAVTLPKDFIVYFDFDKAILTKKAVKTLKEAVAYAKSFGYSKVTIKSSCDFRGTDLYNFDLGARRATAVTRWLSKNGVDKSMFDVTNNGRSLSPYRDLVNGKLCPECWQDRNVSVTIE